MKSKLILLVMLIYSMLGTVRGQVVPGSVVEEDISSYLSTPAANHVKEVPVVILRYIPTIDGINLDVSQATDYWELGNITINALEAHIDDYDKRIKFSLEEGSRFRGYKNPDAVPFLGYKVVKYLSIYRQISVSDFWLGNDGGKEIYQPDYKAEFDALELSDFINENQVKEVWIWFGEAARPGWPSYDPDLHGNITEYVSFVESNMASPSTGDISNSYRYADDLYILDKTYVVYCNNFRRTQAEAVHNHGHQLESIYKYIAERQDGNYSLFVQKFSGWGDNNYTIPPIGRAGDCHHPPNTTTDYDYLNTTLVESDIEDWKPLGGTKKAVNVHTWGDLDYNWPGASDFSQRQESQWYIYWFQSMPGYNNRIPYNQFEMTNWWQFTDDWDLCYAQNIGLYGSATGIQGNVVPDINIFMVPSQDKLIIDLNGNRAEVSIYSIDNKLIKTDVITNGANEIDLYDLISGIYFLKIQNGHQIFVKKFMR